MSQASEQFRKLADSALGLAVIAGFAIPEVGIPISLGAAAIQGLLGFILGPDTSTSDALVDMAQSVAKALAEMQQKISRSVWKAFSAKHKAAVTAALESYSFLLQQVESGAATARDINPVLQQDWQEQLDLVKDDCGRASRLLPVLAWIRSPHNHPHRHELTPLYLLTAALVLNICKLALTIEGIERARAHEERRKATGATMKASEDPEAPRMDRAVVERSVFWSELARRAPELHSSSAARVKELGDALRTLEKDLTKRHDDFQIKSLPDDLACYVDEGKAGSGKGGKFQSEPASLDATKLGMEVARGRALTKLETKRRAELELHELDMDCLESLEQAVKELAKAEAIYAHRK